MPGGGSRVADPMAMPGPVASAGIREPAVPAPRQPRFSAGCCDAERRCGVVVRWRAGRRGGAGVFGGRLRRLGVSALAVVLAAAGVSFVVVRGSARADVTTPRPTGHGTSVAVLSGDFTGDGNADL